VIRKVLLPVLVLILALGVSFPATAENAGFPTGDWAFNYAPEESVLLLREDGTAVLKGQDYTWTDDGEFLTLTEENGETVSLRYLATEKKTLLYFPTEYVRAEDVPGFGLIGAWKGKESEGSTFIFRSDKMFLEDGTFTGTFRMDPEAGTLLLVYIKYFEDTLCYFRLDNDILTVDYPWPMVERQATP